MSESTVSFTIGKHSETGGNSERKSSGRESTACVIGGSQDNSFKLNSGRNKQVSVSTVKRRLGVAGLTGGVAARKPLLSNQNKKKRLAWAMKHH